MPLPAIPPPATQSITPMTVQGDVISTRSFWTDDGSRVVTEATVRTGDGDVVVSQLGGSADGFGQISFPGPAILETGMSVSVTAHHAMDPQQRDHIAVDDVYVADQTGRFAPAYVRSGPTKAGHYLFWESGCIFVTVDSAGTTAITGDAEFPVIDASINTWNTSTASCSYIKVMDQGRQSLEVGKDFINLIKFRDTTWGRPAVDGDPARPYNASAAGLTTATYIDDGTNPRDGAIVDADIEINGVNFAISINGVTNSKQGCHAELQNTLTHEIGHLHGLEHPCRVDGDPPRVDNLGNPVPLCSDAEAENDTKILDATMFNFQNCGETSKEKLSDDDIQGICDIYPTAKDPKTCEPVSGTSGGCCSASGGASPLASIALAGAVLTLARRRKFRRAS